MDGGGVRSTANWLSPRTSADVFKPLRRDLEGLVVKWDLIPRLRDRLRVKSPDQLSKHVRGLATQFLGFNGRQCSEFVQPFQPYTLDIWKACAFFIGDIDRDLPDILMNGVPTGILAPIQPSGVGEPLTEESPEDLLAKDISAGHLFEVAGGEAAARARWGPHVAAGKLGVVLEAALGR